MDQTQRTDEIKARMANRDRNAEPQAQADPAPAVPAAPAAPVQEPVAQVPVTPPPPDPRISELATTVAGQDQEIKRLKDEATQREQELQNLQLASLERAKLPPATELDDMSQGEAILKVAEATMAQQAQQLQDVVTGLNRDVVAPVLSKVGKLDLQAKRETASSAYPQADMNKYRKAFDEMATQYPDMPAPQVLKAVADPRDLSLGMQTPTTPAAVQPAGSYMETGVSAQGSAAQAAQAPTSEPTVQGHLERAYALRNEGDRHGADEARREGLKKRLVDQGTISR